MVVPAALQSHFLVHKRLGYVARRDFSERLAELTEWMAWQRVEDPVADDLETTGLVA